MSVCIGLYQEGRGKGMKTSTYFFSNSSTRKPTVGTTSEACAFRGLSRSMMVDFPLLSRPTIKMLIWQKQVGVEMRGRDEGWTQ